MTPYRGGAPVPRSSGGTDLDEHHDPGAMSRARFDAELAAVELGALTHGEQAEPRRFLRADLEADPVVGDRQRDPSRAVRAQPDRDRPRLRVLDAVGQRFLHDPEQAGLEWRRE